MSGRIKILLRAPLDIVEAALAWWPGTLGIVLRGMYWRRRLHSLGRDVQIDCGVLFQNPEHISIGDGAWIDRGAMILAGPDESCRPRKKIANPDFTLAPGRVHVGAGTHVGPQAIISGIAGVYIGDYCGLAAGCKIYSLSHNPTSMDDPSDRNIAYNPKVCPERQFMVEGPVYIGPNTGVGLHAVILSGASIAADSFVGMNSVATGKFEPNSFIAGSPAKRIKSRFAEGGPSGGAAE